MKKSKKNSKSNSQRRQSVQQQNDEASPTEADREKGWDLNVRMNRSQFDCLELWNENDWREIIQVFFAR